MSDRFKFHAVKTTSQSEVFGLRVELSKCKTTYKYLFNVAFAFGHNSYNVGLHFKKHLQVVRSV